MPQTTNKLFGLADPQYDALRVLSTQALQIGSIDNTTGAGGGLENKIYLWPADGSTITTYDATQAGLIAALAAATTGDTVWLPSIPIALTTGVTVPSGAALVGISENATLSFSGFGGAAVTLAADSLIKFVRVVLVGNDTTAIGIDARFDNAMVFNVEVDVSGGSSSNIAVWAGA